MKILKIYTLKNGKENWHYSHKAKVMWLDLFCRMTKYDDDFSKWPWMTFTDNCFAEIDPASECYADLGVRRISRLRQLC